MLRRPAGHRHGRRALLADQQGHPGGGVEQVGGAGEGGVVGTGDGTVEREAYGPVLGQFLVADVAGNGQYGDPAAGDGGPDGGFERARHLVRGGDGGPVNGHVAEEQVVVDLLEVVAADLGEGNLAADREDGCTALGCVVQTVEQVHGARSDRAHAHPEGAGELSPGARREGRGLLVPASDPLQAVGGADGLGQRVQRVPDDAEDVPDAQFLECVDDDPGDGACHVDLRCGFSG